MNAITPASAERLVRVPLGERSYDILIGPGLIARAGKEIAARLKGRRAGYHHGRECRAALPRAADGEPSRAQGIEAVSLVLPPGEKTKSFEHLMAVCDADARPPGRAQRCRHRARRRRDRRSHRLCRRHRAPRCRVSSRSRPRCCRRWIRPSAARPASIRRHGKNLIGVFHQPDLVLADTDVLDTLSPREFRAGYAEVAKYGLIDKPDFFAWLEANWQEVFCRRCGAHRGDCRQLPGKGRRRRRRRA